MTLQIINNYIILLEDIKKTIINGKDLNCNKIMKISDDLIPKFQFIDGDFYVFEIFFQLCLPYIRTEQWIKIGK